MPLSKDLKVKVKIDLLVRALTICANSQRKAVKHVDALLSIGVPDWRLASSWPLPTTHQTRSHFKGRGLTSAEIRLYIFYPRFSFLCDCLSRHQYPRNLRTHGLPR